MSDVAIVCSDNGKRHLLGDGNCTTLCGIHKSSWNVARADDSRRAFCGNCIAQAEYRAELWHDWARVMREMNAENGDQ
jgi:hypothetical protein